jgi:hypothetical protein
MSQKRTTASAPCGLSMSECTDACAEFASCEHKAKASASCARGYSIADCTDAACTEYATCGAKATASLAACGLAASDCTDAACAEYATCQKKVTAGLAACGISLSDCTDAACGEAACCQQAMAFVLSWGPTLVEELNWAVATAPCGMAMSECTDACAEYATCQKKTTGRTLLLSWGDPVQARPCTDGDDDSEYGPHGDDQKCVDEGGGYGDDDPEYGDNTVEEQGYPGQFDDDDFEDEDDEQSPFDMEDRGRDRSGLLDDPNEYDEEDDDYSSEDVPEGFQEMDINPDLDLEDGDWEAPLDQEEPSDDDLKKTMKEEEKAVKMDKKQQMQEDKENQRTATRINRDGNLGPEDYHQFWNQDSWHVNEARKILEQRAANPKSPEDAEAVRSLLMNGPKVGGAYEKTRKADPGEPGAEDFMDKEDRSPIV